MAITILRNFISSLFEDKASVYQVLFSCAYADGVMRGTRSQEQHDKNKWQKFL